MPSEYSGVRVTISSSSSFSESVSVFSSEFVCSVDLFSSRAVSCFSSDFSFLSCSVFFSVSFKISFCGDG